MKLVSIFLKFSRNFIFFVCNVFLNYCKKLLAIVLKKICVKFSKFIRIVLIFSKSFKIFKFYIILLNFFLVVQKFYNYCFVWRIQNNCYCALMKLQIWGFVPPPIYIFGHGPAMISLHRLGLNEKISFIAVIILVCTVYVLVPIR